MHDPRQAVSRAMAGPEPLTFANGLLPMAVLVALSIGLPALLAARTLSQQWLAVVMCVTGLVVWAVGAAIMAWQYGRANGAMTDGVWSYLQKSALLGLLYGPVLALVWLMRAQGVERRLGLLMQDKGTPK
ncbi:MAG: hypothetical protein ABI832_09850 [bacterium]